ncbi:hypothetical protein BACCAP_00377 [Pseudoflavonifractor capillosus ATCC 29799]|uniref:Uncharacterized protein n=1 Tax=Pseudoflavonifractor capillosus ATCC 29799 TaxID=411467 RepID=A6NQA7_9FIRM|nr:hypothetical protein BACCAP_00377 [Pseudoflavonifractor capillosus ATCC 29799]
MFSRHYYNIDVRSFQLILPMFHVKHAPTLFVKEVKKPGVFHVKHSGQRGCLADGGERWGWVECFT